MDRIGLWWNWIESRSNLAASANLPLKSKHPDGVYSFHARFHISGIPLDIHPVMFDSINDALITSTSLNTTGASGASGLDAYASRKLCTSFKSASNSLCQSLDLIARHLCTEFVDPTCILPYLPAGS